MEKQDWKDVAKYAIDKADTAARDFGAMYRYESARSKSLLEAEKSARAEHAREQRHRVLLGVVASVAPLVQHYYDERRRIQQERSNMFITLATLAMTWVASRKAATPPPSPQIWPQDAPQGVVTA